MSSFAAEKQKLEVKKQAERELEQMKHAANFDVPTPTASNRNPFGRHLAHPMYILLTLGCHARRVRRRPDGRP